MAEEILSARIVFDGSDLGGVGGAIKGNGKADKMADVITDNEGGFRNLRTGGGPFALLGGLLGKAGPIALAVGVGFAAIGPFFGLVEQIVTQLEDLNDKNVEQRETLVSALGSSDITPVTPEEANTRADDYIQSIIDGITLGETTVSTEQPRSIGEKVVDYSLTPEGLEQNPVLKAFTEQLDTITKKEFPNFRTEAENATTATSGGSLFMFRQGILDSVASLQSFNKKLENTKVEEKEPNFLERLFGGG